MLTEAKENVSAAQGKVNWKPQTAKGSPTAGDFIAKKNFLEIMG